MVSSAVLFVLIVLGGFTYTFFMDKQAQPTSAIAKSSAPTELSIKPTKPAPNNAVGASVESISSLVYAGTQASLSVKTTPGATCIVAILYYKTTPATDSGLTPQIADDFGTATWNWTVSPAAPLGLWPVNVTCSYHGKSAVVQTQLDISKP